MPAEPTPDPSAHATRGLLLDLEGVLYEGGQAIAGAREAVQTLRERGLELRFLTNTTVRPRREVAERLTAMGFAIALEHLFTPAMAAAALLREAGLQRVWLAALPGLGEDFAGFTLDEAQPQAVVLGDLHLGFDWTLLNRVFVALRAGAVLIALHKNRYCRRDGVNALDLGPFVAALEYAAGVEARVVGKPSAEFFRLALLDLRLAASEVAMVGDDLQADVGGAQAAGLRAIQVRTGKYDPRDPSPVTPDLVIDSLAALPASL